MKRALIVAAATAVIAATAGVGAAAAFGAGPWAESVALPSAGENLVDAGPRDDYPRSSDPDELLPGDPVDSGYWIDPTVCDRQPETEGCRGGDGVGVVTPDAPPAYETEQRPAIIEEKVINVAESYPPQYFLHVKFGLPSGCAQPGGYEVERNGDVINVTVWTTHPADPEVACTMIYGTASYNIALGSDFEPGRTYTVTVNGEALEFTGQ